MFFRVCQEFFSVFQTLCGIQLSGARLGLQCPLGLKHGRRNWHKGCLFYSTSQEMGVLLAHVERFARGQKTVGASGFNTVCSV
jgi:hypothetical protein